MFGSRFVHYCSKTIILESVLNLDKTVANYIPRTEANKLELKPMIYWNDTAQRMTSDEGSILLNLMAEVARRRYISIFWPPTVVLSSAKDWTTDGSWTDSQQGRF
jgi:hypothetical protein